MSRVFSTIDIKLKPEHRDAYLDAVRDLIVRDHAEQEDLISYELYQDPDDPCHCLITLCWNDERAHQAYMQSAGLKAFFEETQAYLAEAVLSRFFSVKSEQSLL